MVERKSRSIKLKVDGLVKSPGACHCQERSDAAISLFQALTQAEIHFPFAVLWVTVHRNDSLKVGLKNPIVRDLLP